MSHSKKPKAKPIPAADAPDTTQKATSKRWDPRDGLGLYIDKPETNPEGRILEYDDDFVVITDKYPKARCVFHIYTGKTILIVFTAYISCSSPGNKNTTPNTLCISCLPTPPSSRQ